MGKYVRKSRNTGQLALMDVSIHAPPSLGVCTRAKTLALQKSPSAQSTLASAAAASDCSYLQLRSRRLEKPPILVAISDYKRHKNHPKKPRCLRSPNRKSNSRVRSRLKVASVDSQSSGSPMTLLSQEKCFLDSEKKAVIQGENVIENDNKGNSGDLGVEASFSENVLQFDGGERSTRETTPCSLIRNPDCIRTPGSTTRPTCSIEPNSRAHNSRRRNTLNTNEMDKFFSGAEEEQQNKFIEKYNFDPVKDVPLLGRYKWEKMHP